ncbi:MAG TPA: FecR family protein [Spirochaetota bacterium]|nr:FecR family protein [Spirochaetota bacterium]HQJ69387.1 FecR family protein [Spirochaetota bacterium]HRS76044.1 FecR family protein [Spirochaetota bacterium]HRT73708.1 FecR family protein [Spirochaetota bacterium]
MNRLLPLLLLTCLTVPFPGCKKEGPDKTVKLYSMVGTVTVTFDRADKPAAVGDVLGPGDRITTGTDSIADILFGTAGIIRVQPDTTVSISSLMDPGTGDTQLDMPAGKMNVTLAKLTKGSFRVKTATAVAAVRGTSFRITAGEKVMRLDVVAGSVQVNPVKDNVIVPEIEKTVETNQTVKIDEAAVKKAVEEKKEIEVKELKPEEAKQIREEVKDIKPEMLEKINASAREEIKEKIIAPDDSAEREKEKEEKERKEKERSLKLLQEKKLRQQMMQKKAEPIQQKNENKPAETKGDGSKNLPPSVNTL